MTITRQVLRDQIAKLRVLLRTKETALAALEKGEKRRRRALPDFQLAKTRCPAGHKYAGKNLILTRDGERKCRQCKRLYDRKHLEKKRSTRPAARSR